MSLETERSLKESKRGSVLLVRDTAGGARYILRVFAGEAEVYRKIKSAAPPHIPEIQAVAERDGKTYVLEEYIQGDTLAFLLDSKPLSPEAAGRAIRQLCDTLEVLHGLGVVHRDIKPENVILRGNEAVLIDFDVSRLRKPERSSDTRAMGTAGYAAPEQYGFSQTDGRADIYALGVMLNEMLTKQHPSKRLTEGAFRPIVEKCIEVNVDKRYASAAELRAALLSASGSEKRKRHMRLGLPLCLLALVLAGAGIYAALSAGESTPAAGTVSTVSPPPTSAPDITPSQSVAEVWPGKAEPAWTDFRYDLDGDGQEEDYVFGSGLYIVDVGGLVFSRWDGFSWTGEQKAVKLRELVPCVWRYDENGQAVEAPEFAALLQDAETTLWRVSNTDCPAPEVFPLEMDGWNGGVSINYTGEHIGVWLYEYTAELDGLTLTATSLTEILE